MLSIEKGKANPQNLFSCAQVKYMYVYLSQVTLHKSRCFLHLFDYEVLLDGLNSL